MGSVFVLVWGTERESPIHISLFLFFFSFFLFSSSLLLSSLFFDLGTIGLVDSHGDVHVLGRNDDGGVMWDPTSGFTADIGMIGACIRSIIGALQFQEGYGHVKLIQLASDCSQGVRHHFRFTHTHLSDRYALQFRYLVTSDFIYTTIIATPSLMDII